MTKNKLSKNEIRLDEEEASAPGFITPELELIAAVIKQAIIDLFLPKKRMKILVRARHRLGEKNLYRYEYQDDPDKIAAYCWLFDKNTGFDKYCYLLGWDIDFMRKEIRRKIKEGAA